MQWVKSETRSSHQQFSTML
uniref:Uncharacterized protein n=1 Tax=Arundo donax TaxID=35708 RepID=A0A0A8Y6P8_ARUDO